MTERNVSGDAIRTRYRKAQAKISELGLTPDVVDILAEGVREFDEQRSAEQRTVSALERIAGNTTPERDRENSWAWEDRRLRRREVYAQELAAISLIADDGELAAIRSSAAFKALLARLTYDSAATT